MLNFNIEHHWDEQSSQVVMNGLKAFNLPFIGADQPQKLAIIVRNEQQEIIGGLLGETKWNWMYIGWVWITEKYRMHGIGRKLIGDAENEARTMGCDHTHLTTLDFQAKVFYEKLGYEVFAALEDFPQGHIRFMMKKRIS